MIPEMRSVLLQERDCCRAFKEKGANTHLLPRSFSSSSESAPSALGTSVGFGAAAALAGCIDSGMYVRCRRRARRACISRAVPSAAALPSASPPRANECGSSPHRLCRVAAWAAAGSSDGCCAPHWLRRAAAQETGDSAGNDWARMHIHAGAHLQAVSSRIKAVSTEMLLLLASQPSTHENEVRCHGVRRRTAVWVKAEVDDVLCRIVHFPQSRWCALLQTQHRFRLENAT